MLEIFIVIYLNIQIQTFLDFRYRENINLKREWLHV